MLASRGLITWHICADKKFFRNNIQWLTIVAFLFFSMFGCKPAIEHSEHTQIVLTPSSGYQDSELLISFSNIPISFNECQNFHNWSSLAAVFFEPYIEFVNIATGAAELRIKVSSIENVTNEQFVINAGLLSSVPAGDYRVEFKCNPEQFFYGNFTVNDTITQHALVFEPAVVSAGNRDQFVAITLSPSEEDTEPVFQGLPTSAMFGTGNDVTASEVEISDDKKRLSVYIGVSELALKAGQTSKEVEVTLVSWPNVYSGFLTILPGNAPTIQMDPHRIYKPLFGEAEDELTVEISGSNVSFASDGENNPENVTVDIPQNPGIRVESCLSVSQSKMRCNLQVRSNAFLGPTAVVIQTGNMKTMTSLNIVPKAGIDRVIRFSPPLVENCVLPVCSAQYPLCNKNACPTRLVFAEALGFEFDDSWTPSVVTPGIILEKYEILDSNVFALWLYLEENNPAKVVEIAFSNIAESMTQYLLVKDVNGKGLKRVSDLFQGHDDSNGMSLYMQNSTIDFNPSAHISDRSGVYLGKGTPLVTETQKIGINIEDAKVIGDAPTGPVRIAIEDSTFGEYYEAFFKVKPHVASTAWISISPEVVWLPRKQATLTFQGHGEMQFSSETEFILDYPGIEIVSVEIDSSNLATVKIENYNSAQRGIAHFYVQTGNAKAGAAVRVEKQPGIQIKSIESPILYRKAEQGKIFIRVSDVLGEPISMSIFEDIGVQIERYYTTIDKNEGEGIAVIFSLDKVGPGGWIGLNMNIGGRQVVIPIQIDADDTELDDLLTASITPSSVIPGSKNVEGINIELPYIQSTQPSQGATLGDLFTKSYSIKPSTYVAVDSISKENPISATLVGDFASNLPLVAEGMTFPGFPIAITATSGAGIGFLNIKPVNMPEMMTVIASDEINQFSIDSALSFFTAFFSKTNSANYGSNQLIQVLAYEKNIDDFIPVEASVLGDDRLDSRSMAADGVLWTVDSKDFYIAAKHHSSYNIVFHNYGNSNEIIGEGEICAQPRLIVDTIDVPIEVDAYLVPPSQENCRLTATVSARTLNPNSSQTPDMKITLCDTEGTCAGDVSDSQVAGNDPIVYFDSQDVSKLRLQGEIGTTGYYLLNVRGTSLIRQISRDVDNLFVELGMEPGTSMENCHLDRVSPMTGELLFQQELSGVVPSSGSVFISEQLMSWVTIPDDSGLTAISLEDELRLLLFCDGVLADSVQIGGSGEYVIINTKAPCLRRIGNSIDTNRNRHDFQPSTKCEIFNNGV